MRHIIKYLSVITLCYQGHAFATATFDPATNVLQLPLVEIGSGTQKVCAEASLALTGGGQFNVTGTKPLTCVAQFPEPTKQDAEQLQLGLGKWRLTFKQTGKPDITTDLDVSKPTSTSAYWSPTETRQSKYASLEELLAGKPLRASSNGVMTGSSSVQANFQNAFSGFSNPYSSYGNNLSYSPYELNWSNGQPTVGSTRTPFSTSVQIDNNTVYSIVFALTAGGTLEGSVRYLYVSGQTCSATSGSSSTGFSYQSLPSGVSITVTGTRI